MHIKIKSFQAIVCAAIFCSSPAFAQSNQPPESVSALISCKLIADNAERLGCYDTAVGKFELAQTDGEILTITREEVQKAKKESFGFSLPTISNLGKLFDSDEDAAQKSQPDDKVKQTFTIERVDEFGRKKTRFYFTNGQVWDQTDSTSVHVPKVKSGKPNTLVIKKAAMGSFLARVNGNGRSIRVKRNR